MTAVSELAKPYSKGVKDLRSIELELGVLDLEAEALLVLLRQGEDSLVLCSFSTAWLVQAGRNRWRHVTRF